MRRMKCPLTEGSILLIMTAISGDDGESGKVSF